MYIYIIYIYKKRKISHEPTGRTDVRIEGEIYSGITKRSCCPGNSELAIRLSLFDNRIDPLSLSF